MQKISLLEQNVRRFLWEWPGLNVFCTQNGWIDNDTLWFEIQSRRTNEVTVAVKFIEILMEGSGCVADRRECFGKLRLRLGENNEIVGVEVI